MEYLSYVSLKVVKEKRTSIESRNIGSPSDVVNFLKREIADRDREYFVVLSLDTKNKIQAVENISIGSLNATIVHPREVFKYAILKNSAGIIIAHNHPSGNPNPSKEDESITKRLVESGKILGIRVLDHLIVCEDSHFSFKEDGLI